MSLARSRRDPAPVYVRALDLATWLEERVDASGPTIWSTLAERATALCVDLALALMLPSERRSGLARADRGLVELRVRLRVLQAAARIERSQARYLIDSVDEIGRMVGGWRRAESRRARRSVERVRDPQAPTA